MDIRILLSPPGLLNLFCSSACSCTSGFNRKIGQQPISIMSDPRLNQIRIKTGILKRCTTNPDLRTIIRHRSSRHDLPRSALFPPTFLVSWASSYSVYLCSLEGGRERKMSCSSERGAGICSIHPAHLCTPMLSTLLGGAQHAQRRNVTTRLSFQG